MLVNDEQIKQLVLSLNLVEPKELESIEELVKQSQIPLADAIIEKGIITGSQLGQLIANQLKIPFVNLSRISISKDVFALVPEKIAKKRKMIAFARDNEGVKIAMADPSDREIISLLEQKTKQKVIPYLATVNDITQSFKYYKTDLQMSINKLLQIASIDDNPPSISEAPIAKIVETVILYAYQNKTSDIHIEPQEKYLFIRFRIDGILHDVLKLPKILQDQISTRIKVLSKLRTDEHLSPQDGKIRFKIEDEDDYIDIRISILPIVDGEKIVARLLASKNQQLSLSEIGVSQKDYQKVIRAIHKPYGMILSTGPTGSGKTSSIYAILKILNSRSKNITTVEDPVEYIIPGINQIQVNTKTALTFASGLRSILRQDPNIIFVGEIRDNETAGIAVNAALTGHLVLSTLHTNDAATTLPRLSDMKVEPFLVASTVNLIIAQRLVRKICDMCRAAYTITREELLRELPESDIMKNFQDNKYIQIYKGVGCKICHNTGYNGRLGIFEVLEVNQNIKQLITSKNDSDSIQKQAIADGMSLMLEDGLQKVAKGITTIEEVLRVTKVESV